MTRAEHANRAAFLRQVAGRLQRDREIVRTSMIGPSNAIPSEALECIARAADQLLIARDHIERAARDHERNARPCECGRDIEDHGPACDCRAFRPVGG